MGNRFAQQPQYHTLIRAHGIIASITFLAIVPAAILIMRFYGPNPRWALRFHIWLQILTLLLTTVIFVLGWLAVGPSRKLTNPHHGIGLAIYVLVIFQFFGGWWVHRKEKGKKRLYEPMKVMVRFWIALSANLVTYGSSSTIGLVARLLSWASHRYLWGSRSTDLLLLCLYYMH